MRCAHCHYTAKDVSKWNQIMSFDRGTVCCFLKSLPIRAER